jgi:uncharacterized protein (DUF4415 family)
MAKTRLGEIAEHAETHDFGADITERGVWEADGEPDPMVTTSLRLPKSLLDWVRAQADQEHTRPTALMRQWIEQRRDLGGTDLTNRIERLEEAVFHKSAS